jgi:hypothetical protein
MSESPGGTSFCLLKRLPRALWVEASRTAAEINPVNHPHLEQLARIDPEFDPTPERIALVTTRYWAAAGVRLTVGFLDNPTSDLRARILTDMNVWDQVANVSFVETATDPQVRIARTPGDGHWSYLGTDILCIPADQPTMNLDSYTMNTPDMEIGGRIGHATGHTLGITHEHLRRVLVERIDEDKAIEYFRRTQGWNEEEVRLQVLTPIEESSLLGTPHADPDSIMCYQIPGEITKDGRPILGSRMRYTDRFAAKLYPNPLR